MDTIPSTVRVAGEGQRPETHRADTRDTDHKPIHKGGYVRDWQVRPQRSADGVIAPGGLF